MHLFITFVPVCILLLYVSAASSVVSWTAGDYTAECGSGVPSSWLCDPEHVLDAISYANVTTLLTSINVDTKGVVSCNGIEYSGYIVAAAIVGTTSAGENGDTSTSVTKFGTDVQQSWFGDHICDNSTLVVLSLNASKIFVIYGAGTSSRLRTHHKQACTNIQVDGNVTSALMGCLEDLDRTLEDALKPMTNTALGYGGVLIVMTMLMFHYWIKY